MTTSTKPVALVTGASSGMGKDFAKTLLREGMTVYVAARRLEQMEDLRALGAIALAMDISQDDQVQAVVERILGEHGSVDVLINNAGFGQFAEAMVERSGRGTYAGLVEGLVKAQTKTYAQGDSSPPGVISELALAAVRAKRLKTRYLGGKYAKLLTWIRRWLGDRAYDRLIMGMVK